MIRVVELQVPLQTANAFEVAIALTIRDLRAFDALDQPHASVKFLQVFESTQHKWMGAFWVEPFGSGEPIEDVPIRTPIVEKPIPITVVIEETHVESQTRTN